MAQSFGAARGTKLSVCSEKYIRPPCLTRSLRHQASGLELQDYHQMKRAFTRPSRYPAAEKCSWHWEQETNNSHPETSGCCQCTLMSRARSKAPRNFCDDCQCHGQGAGQRIPQLWPRPRNSNIKNKETVIAWAEPGPVQLVTPAFN